MKCKTPRFGFLYHWFGSFVIGVWLLVLIIYMKENVLIETILIVCDSLFFVYFALSLFLSLTIINKTIIFDDYGMHQKRFKNTIHIDYSSIVNVTFFYYHTLKMPGYMVVYDGQNKISFDLYGKAFKYFFEHCNNQKVQRHLLVFMKDRNYE